MFPKFIAFQTTKVRKNERKEEKKLNKEFILKYSEWKTQQKFDELETGGKKNKF